MKNNLTVSSALAVGEGYVDKAERFFYFIYQCIELCVCEYESGAHVLAVSSGLIVDRVESLRGLGWMGVLFK